ncbi:MAG: hypothetical protein K6T65_11445 [Peptococcaceae bacterium]|nr:hypothetical protein [Peptococcaceae bacterium]
MKRVKKLIVMTTLAISLMTFAVPALADPNENASPRAFLAQHINECRDHMKDMVASGEMTPDELKACVGHMKSEQCVEHCCDHEHNQAHW